ncbi:hypothetical protein ACFQE1_16110 [Halobium palmae]|uniref:Uncharacterized protein n=1 Tax=Halobium palmae TaxID=1776492 RepID=A0ABD5S312_9EURY
MRAARAATRRIADSASLTRARRSRVVADDLSKVTGLPDDVDVPEGVVEGFADD